MHRFVALGLFAVLSFGCDAESEDAEDEADSAELAEAQQAFTGAVTLAIVPPAGTYDFDSAAAGSGYTAFLQSVVGNFERVSRDAFVRAAVAYGGTNDLVVTASPGSASAVLGLAGTALTPGARGPEVSCSNADGTPDVKTVTAPSGAALWKCGLTRISNSNGNSFGSYGDQAYISYVGTTAKLNCVGNAQASARCIEVSDVDEYVEFNGSDDRYVGPTATGKTCFLTKVSGILRTNSATLGVTLYQKSGTSNCAPGVSQCWWLDVDSNLGGAAQCMK